MSKLKSLQADEDLGRVAQTTMQQVSERPCFMRSCSMLRQLNARDVGFVRNLTAEKHTIPTLSD